MKFLDYRPPYLTRSFNQHCSELIKSIVECDPVGFEKRLQDALSAGYPIDYTPSTGYLPLLLFAIDKVTDNPASEEIVEILIKHGANVNLKSPLGNNALMQAARNNNIRPDLFGLIVSKTTDLNHKNDLGDTGFDILAWRYTDTLYIPKTRELKERGITGAKCKVLIDAGIDIDYNGKWNESKKDPTKEERRKELYDLIKNYQESRKQLLDTSQNTMIFDYEI